MPTLWPFCPAAEFTEALEWTSDVLPAYSAEQRIALTYAPRQTLNFTHAMTFRQWERAKLLMQLVSGGSWYVPLWHERQRVTVGSGAGSITVDTTASDYRASGYALLWESDEVCEVVAVNTVGASALTLTGTTSRAYTAGFVAPVRVAYCPDGLEGDRSVDPIVQSSAEFIVYDSEDLADSSLYTTYRSYPVITDRSMVGSGSFNEQIARQMDVVDNGLAVPFYDSVSDRLARSLGFAWMPSTLADLWSLRTWLHALRGRQKAFWVPDWTRGLELTDDVAPGDTTISVRAVGLNGVAETGDLMIRTTAGQLSRHQFTSVAVSGASEVLTLSGAAGVTVAMGSERTVCLMRLCRLAQDRIEFAHRYLGRDRQLTSVMVRADEVPYA